MSMIHHELPQDINGTALSFQTGHFFGHPKKSSAA